MLIYIKLLMGGNERTTETALARQATSVVEINDV